MIQQQQNLGRRFGTSKMHLSFQVALAAAPSKAKVLLLLIRCLLLLPLWDSVIVLCFVALLFVHSCFAIISIGKRELVALLCLSSLCLVIVVWLFLTMPRVDLQYVIVIFPDHTHYFLVRKQV